MVLHIEDPRSVRLLGPLTGRFRQREVPVVVTYDQPEFKWGKYMPQIEFVTRLLSRASCRSPSATSCSSW